MKLDEIKNVLATSSQDQWIIDDETGSFTYKDNLNLHIERADYDTYRSFDEPWATGNPDSTSSAVEYTVKYCSSFIERHKLVSVDGHRATLPIPESMDSLRVRPSEVNFARIVDMGDRVEEYLGRSQIRIEEY